MRCTTIKKFDNLRLLFGMEIVNSEMKLNLKIRGPKEIIYFFMLKCLFSTFFDNVLGLRSHIGAPPYLLCARSPMPVVCVLAHAWCVRALYHTCCARALSHTCCVRALPYLLCAHSLPYLLYVKSVCHYSSSKINHL